MKWAMTLYICIWIYMCVCVCIHVCMTVLASVTSQAGCYGHHGKVLPQRNGCLWFMRGLQPINMAAQVLWTEDEGCTMHIITVRLQHACALTPMWPCIPSHPHWKIIGGQKNAYLYLTPTFVLIAQWSRRSDRTVLRSLWSLSAVSGKTRSNLPPAHHMWLAFWAVQRQWTSVKWVSPGWN